MTRLRVVRDLNQDAIVKVLLRCRLLLQGQSRVYYADFVGLACGFHDWLPALLELRNRVEFPLPAKQISRMFTILIFGSWRLAGRDTCFETKS